MDNKKVNKLQILSSIRQSYEQYRRRGKGSDVRCTKDSIKKYRRRDRRYQVDQGRHICRHSGRQLIRKTYLYDCISADSISASFLTAGFHAPCFIAAIRLLQTLRSRLEHTVLLSSDPVSYLKFSISLFYCLFLELNSRIIDYKTHTFTTSTPLHLIQAGTNILCITDVKFKIVLVFTHLNNLTKIR